MAQWRVQQLSARCEWLSLNPWQSSLWQHCAEWTERCWRDPIPLALVTGQRKRGVNALCLRPTSLRAPSSGFGTVRSRTRQRLLGPAVPSGLNLGRCFGGGRPVMFTSEWIEYGPILRS